MLSIFTKRHFLADLLENFTDIHCHILPGIDDGAKNLEDAEAILRKYGQLGVENFIATPHIMVDYYPNNSESIYGALEKLRGYLSKKSLSHINIRAAAEYMMDYHFEDLLEKQKILALKDNYVLVETSFLQPPFNLDSIIYDIQQQGFTPVLAHPERYSYFSSAKKFGLLKDNGCLFQLNALSLSTYYGRDVQKKSIKLLENGWYDFLGTDTHRLNHLETLQEIKVDSKKHDLLQKIVRNTNELFDENR